ncbi:MAG: hypothetical protein AAF467_25060 [Actinomycetota bacterium]
MPDTPTPNDVQALRRDPRTTPPRRPTAPTPALRSWTTQIGALSAVLGVLMAWVGPGLFSIDEAAYRYQGALRQAGLWGLPYPTDPLTTQRLGAPLANSLLTDSQWFPYASHPLVPELVRATMALHPTYGPLALSAIGTVMAAVGIERLTRWARGSDHDGSTPFVAFWVTGLASPLLIQGLIAWAHAPAVGAAALGASLVVAPPGGPGAPCGAGAEVARHLRSTGIGLGLLALTPLFRTEAVLFAAALGVGLAWLEWREGRRWWPRASAVAAATGAGLMLDTWWRARVVGQTSAAAETGLTMDAVERLSIVSDLILAPGSGPLASLRAVAAIVLVAAAIWLRRRPEEATIAHVLVGSACACALIGSWTATAYPGLLVAVPAIVVAAALRSPLPAARREFLLIVTVLAVAAPAVTAPYPPGLDWGGRYVLMALTTALPFVIAGLERAARSGAAAIVVGVAIVTALGQVAGIRTLTASHDASVEISAHLATTLPAITGDPTDVDGVRGAAVDVIVTTDVRLGRLVPAVAASVPMISAEPDTPGEVIATALGPNPELDRVAVARLFAAPTQDLGPAWRIDRRWATEWLHVVEYVRNP